MSEYKRLTQWTEKGASLDLGDPKSDMEARQALMEQFKKACNKLAELEDKLEEGTLVELPCKVGDTFYSVDFIFSDGYEFDKKGHEKAVHFSGWKIIKTEVTEKNIYRICDMYVSGKIFETREAAESRLKELEK